MHYLAGFMLFNFQVYFEMVLLYLGKLLADVDILPAR